MAVYHKQNTHGSKRKVSISYVIRDREERRHRSGVNSLEYDYQLDRLYSAGRDSVIRIWDIAADDTRLTGSNQNGCYNSSYSPNAVTSNNDYYVQSMEHHTDWVNDISLCCNGRNLTSVSNDTTIKVWNAHQGFCLSTLRSHKDYAKCLAYAKDREIIASAGFDNMIYLWDIQALTQLTATKNTVTTKPLEGSKNSIYSLAINETATLVASGSTEKLIRLWDPRSRHKLLKLRGHTDNVRSLLFSRDGSQLLSASSDGTIRLWSISQQRCLSIIRVHDEGVWTLQATDSFGTVFSGGKDGKLFMTDLKNTSNTSLVCVESASILKILLVNRRYSKKGHINNGHSLWVTTTDSSIRNWRVDLNYPDKPIEDITSDGQSLYERPLNHYPDILIKGNPAVINYHILNDKQHILTRESDNSVALYDVLRARKVKVLHKVNNEAEAKELYTSEIEDRYKMMYVPNWFSVDLKIGLLCIHLDESECLSAWVTAKDYGFIAQSGGQDPKVNLGCLMLQAILKHWPPVYEGYDSDTRGPQSFQGSIGSNNIDEHTSLPHTKSCQQSGRFKRSDEERDLQNVNSNQYFAIADHTPIIISEGNQTLSRFLALEACHENEDLFLREIIPSWISDIVVLKCQPKFTKIPFFLLPHTSSGIKSLKRERLSASDMLQMKKVIDHVCEKMIVSVVDENGHSAGYQEQGQGSMEPSNSPIASVELFCNDKKLDENLDLRTVKHCIWKAGGDLVLHYMPIK